MTRTAARHLAPEATRFPVAVPALAGRRSTALATGAALSVPGAAAGLLTSATADAAPSSVQQSVPKALKASAPVQSVRAAVPSTVLRYGSTGSLVRTVQARVGTTVDGIFGPRTLAKVKAFQRSHGLVADGIVGKYTWSKLGVSTGGTASGSSCATSTVRYGSTGSAVRTLQSRIGVTSDGVFGPRTLSALRTYQRSHGLVVDGVAGPATWRSLGCSTSGGTGSGGTVSSPSAQYRMPFPGGVTRKITQGANGSFSHNGPYDRFAIDFSMPTGSSVVASRGGTVYKASWDQWGGGNSVMVKDASGLCMQYNHLSKINVSVGQSVSQGQLLARSGSTGNSTGPHLHWSLVGCSSYSSTQVARSVERGTSYPAGVSVTSANR